jgi:transposase
MWVTTIDLPTAASHPFYRRLNHLLREHGFDDFAEAECAGFYAETIGRPGLPPGTYFRLLPIGYFEAIDSERGIAWRAADSLALRDFVGVGLDEAPPDHSTISRTRRLIDLETHRAVFTCVLQCMSTAGLVKGKTIGIDATTLEADVTKMKDGRTHLAHKAEHAIDLETGAIVGITVQGQITGTRRRSNDDPGSSRATRSGSRRDQLRCCRD